MATVSPVNFDSAPSAGTKRRADKPLATRTLEDKVADSLLDNIAVMDPAGELCSLLKVALGWSLERQAILAEKPGLLLALLKLTKPGIALRTQILASDAVKDLVDAWHRTRGEIKKGDVWVQGTANLVLDNGDLVCELLGAMARGDLTWPWRVLKDAIRFQDKCRAQGKYNAVQLLARIPGIVECLLDIMDAHSINDHDWDPRYAATWASGLLRAGIVSALYGDSGVVMTRALRAASPEKDVSDVLIARALRAMREPSTSHDGAVTLILARKAPLSERQLVEARAVVAFRKAMQTLSKHGDRLEDIRSLERYLDECEAKQTPK